MKAKKVMAVLTAVCMSVSMAGVVSAAEENTGVDPSTIEKAAEDSSVKIGVLMKTMSDAYSNKLGTAIQDYVEKNYPNAELYLMDGQADIAKQISQAEDIIAKQVDVIILNPQDADGSAQVNGRKEVPWPERIELNVWYAQHMSLGLDLKIFFMTITKVVTNANNENVEETGVKLKEENKNA